MQTTLPRRTLLTFASLGAGLLALPARAQPQRFVEGTHYVTLPDNALSRMQAAASAPLVTEIFWYGCGHCYAFDPMLGQWTQELGEAIAFSRSPAVWDAATKSHARLFEATRQLGIHDQVHEHIFDEIHRQGHYLMDEASQLTFLENSGVAREQAEAALGSFQVDSAVRKAEALVREIKVPGIPAMVVKGRYLVKIDGPVRSHQDLLQITDYLLQQTS